MMRRLTTALGALIVYLSIGTVLAQAVIVGFLWRRGCLDSEKLREFSEVMRGTRSTAIARQAASRLVDASEQLSFEQIERQRAVQARHIELREQAIQSGLERIRYERRKLGEEKESYERLRAAFEKHLEETRSGALAAGRENIRLIWENIKPRQAKEQILQMIDNGELEDVVAILSGMPIGKRAKIVGEFKTEEENKKLDEILRMIRQGMPEVGVLDETREQLRDFEHLP
jgi:hypothetical protein